ncbi:MAG: HEAT repeat domain-containing protein [Ignavibacteriaceae bacterium]|nr:HEAT repeat domain-containing protein [Ignavibacteriaceae bacterium]
MKYFILILFLLINPLLLNAQEIKIIKPAKSFKTSFAIVVDNKTFAQCETEVMAYKKSVEDDSLSAFILISDWQDPRIIRDELKKLYSGKPSLEGAVFVGDIPIPMIRNAQHMTSAFKLDEERYPWFRSACPSDRFYEDFDLIFNNLGRDTVNTLCHYYSLAPESPQRIHKEIYSGRIIPSGDAAGKYAAISRYLSKVVKQKKNPEPIDKAFIYTGHGYHSESLSSWADERILLSELFPQLFRGPGRFEYWNHTMSNDIKDIVMTRLQDPDLDLAIFHAHGSDDMQLLSSYPIPQNTQENIESVKLYLRSKVRSARDRKQDVAKTIEYFKSEFDVPDSWFEGAFVDSVIAADSVMNYRLDIYLQDIRSMKPAPKYIMFDQCFNASFHQNEYVAGEYVFGDNGVINGEGNAVNCLQDKYADELIGLFNYSVRTGLRLREINNLETHIIGDPTFRFANKEGLNFNYLLRDELRKNEKLWRQLYKSQYPVLRSLALRRLKEIKGNGFSDELLALYDKEQSFEARTTIVKMIGDINDKNFVPLLRKSVNDPYEFIRRKSAEFMGETGDTSLIRPMANQLINDESDRVSYQLRESMKFLDIEKSAEVFEQEMKKYPDYIRNKKMLDAFKFSVERTKIWVYDELLVHLYSDTLKLRSRLSEARTFRNYKFHQVIPQIVKLVLDVNQPLELRVHCSEALGWFNLSNRRFEIMTALEPLVAKQDTPDKLRAELVRTLNRLRTGPNDVMLP